MDLSQQQAQELLHTHREHLQLRTCSFGRHGRPSYAVCTQAEVQRLCYFANVSGLHGATVVVQPILLMTQCPIPGQLNQEQPPTRVETRAEKRIPLTPFAHHAHHRSGDGDDARKSNDN
ncbi:hypothetical protein VOLCADRAFT_98144 [Volvox carteri f. nagariensis]|uniref:Uncharacterized protein n=1 Tax=Volvox carteri f. nagariensis TaxID=3068 RepID=D8UEK0_VOLCA|nr:uncharacterized protein VOLCADRAFT_98144 [Volvox carteri f. nagariensis]EFJ41857.1 hypothetical protein VOLCADRAFT_98144 [Volvox carteri f. nagariensis]|eukprot:XP_002957055.1 hypothetical protein VOLCADRAFT_98144 [Volvox carteri f. nagariensis]